MRALYEGLCHDAAKFGVQLCLIEPGFVDTELTTRYRWMPFHRSAERAATRFVRRVEAGATVIRYPWQFVWLARLASAIPRPIRDRVL